MKNLIIVILLLLGLFSCSADEPLFPVHHSADFSVIYIYLSQNLAIAKSTQLEGDGKEKTFFHFGMSKWMGESEYADDPGDNISKSLIDYPTYAGASEDGKWLIIEGKNQAGFTTTLTNCACAINPTSGNYYISRDIATLEQQVQAKPSSFKLKLQPVEVFFDRELISRLQKK